MARLVVVVSVLYVSFCCLCMCMCGWVHRQCKVQYIGVIGGMLLKYMGSWVFGWVFLTDAVLIAVGVTVFEMSHHLSPTLFPGVLPWAPSPHHRGIPFHRILKEPRLEWNVLETSRQAGRQKHTWFGIVKYHILGMGTAARSCVDGGLAPRPSTSPYFLTA